MFGFGKKQSHATPYGKKQESIFKKGFKWIGKSSAPIKSAADSVADVSGTIGNIAATALPFTAEIPVVGELVGGAAVLGKGVQYAAKGVSSVAGTASSAYKAGSAAERGIDAARHHRLGEAISQGKEAVKQGKATRKGIQRGK